jgi:OmcA/MtrC family decaheme c-type cytochrome
LPAGAIKIEYEINSVTRTAGGNPQMMFRMKQNGVVTPMLDFATAPTNAATGQKEIWANFMGAPSVYFVFAVPQDGITAPADFNATASVYLRSLWNGTAAGTSAGTLTGPDANGWYTATITGATVPANAVMLTGGLGYSYNARTSLPLTQTNLTAYPATASTVSGLTAGMPNAWGGLIVIAPNVQRVATGFTGRRAIVADTKCNACHQELGTFTEDAFHAGQRNDGTTCSWCHTPNRASSGWTAQTDNMTHAIHAAAKRNVPYTWHAVSADDNFSKIKYPGVLARCEQCHLAGTFDFAASSSANAAGLGGDQIDKRQARLVASGTLTASVALSPYVTAGTNYGANFSYNVGTGATVQADPTTLVLSPTVAACVACHDSNLAISHYEVNGGSFYQARSVEATRTEQCFVCHASGRVAGITEVHAR